MLPFLRTNLSASFAARLLACWAPSSRSLPMAAASCTPHTCPTARASWCRRRGSNRRQNRRRSIHKHASITLGECDWVGPRFATNSGSPMGSFMSMVVQRHELTTGCCANCGRGVVFARRVSVPDYRLHALLTLVTGGLWIVGWIARCCQSGAWECAECGAQVLGPSPAPVQVTVARHASPRPVIREIASRQPV